MSSSTLKSAYELLDSSVIYYRKKPVGTMAACDPKGLEAENYSHCFVRDFFTSALVFLADGKYDIVRNFLTTVLDLHAKRQADTNHRLAKGVMPASFCIITGPDGSEHIEADFGDLAIGRVTPVDSMMWWTILLGMYSRVSGDTELLSKPEFQQMIRQILEMLLSEGFEDFPTMLVPDGAFMIDRRLGVYGHPLEIQCLLYATLDVSYHVLQPGPDNDELRELVQKHQQALRSYLGIFYWLDLERLNEIHRFDTEQFGTGSVNMLNIYPQSIPDWVVEWLPKDAGYLVGNLGAGRMDFRFFAKGNLLAINYGIVAEKQAQGILNLYEERWDDLVGEVPLKICYPALEGAEWRLMTGSDPKNVPWSYHNAGSWPALLSTLVIAATRMGRGSLARRALEQSEKYLVVDQWPEYYDGRSGRLIGRRANHHQVWSAASYIIAYKAIFEPEWMNLLGPKSWQVLNVCT